MPAVAVSAVGTAWSIYSGMKQQKAAEQAQDAAQGQWQSEQDFAKQRYQNWYNTFFPVAKQRIQELQSKNLLPEDAMALGKMQEGFQRQEKNLDTRAGEGLLPSGAANGAYQDLALRKAMGTSSIALQDEAQKNSQLGQWYQMGLSEPTSSYLVQGAARDNAMYQDTQAQRYAAGANSDWTSVAKGMMSIADSMAQNNVKKNGGAGVDPGNSGTPATAPVTSSPASYDSPMSFPTFNGTPLGGASALGSLGQPAPVGAGSSAGQGGLGSISANNQ